jgi:hypothetical protein
MLTTSLKNSQPDDLKAPTTRQTLALPPSSVPEQPRKITQEEREFKAYKTLRNYRAETRFEGARKIRAAKASYSPHLLVPARSQPIMIFQKEEEEAAKKK